MKRTVSGLLAIILLVCLAFGVMAVRMARSYLSIGMVNIPPAITPAVSDYAVEEFVAGLFVPWSMAFTSPDRLLVTERSGALREIKDGKLVTEPVYVFGDVYAKGEAGLMGLVLHPGYLRNRFVYIAYAYSSSGGVQVKVVRLEDAGKMQSPRIILDAVPAAQNHAGTRLKFGKDGKLYVSTGDASNRPDAQDLSSLAGKILRLNDDGSVPSDNPIPGSYVYAFGFRNTQGMDWDPVSGTMWSTDHGPSVFDGPAGGDEINRVLPKGNYGWPVVSHDRSRSGMESPKLVFTPAVAPAAMLFYDTDVLPMFRGNLFFGALRGTGVYRIILNEDRTSVRTWEKLSKVNVGRVREVIQGPDGYIYFSTSNRDGRGEANPGDDRIYRIVPDIKSISE